MERMVPPRKYPFLGIVSLTLICLQGVAEEFMRHGRRSVRKKLKSYYAEEGFESEYLQKAIQNI